MRVCKDCGTQPYLSIKVEMKEVETFLLKPKKIRSDESAKVTRLLIKWSFDQRFGFSMTEYELRKSFLRIEFEADEKVVG